MWTDEILEEVRRAREAHTEKFNYNLLEIYQNIKKQEQQSNKIFVSYSAKHIQLVK